MVTKKKSAGQGGAKKSRVKVGKLKLNKETVKDLSGSKAKKIKGGQRAQWYTAASNQAVCCA